MEESPPFKSRDITGISLVVDNAAAIAERYARLFGVSAWRFFDLESDSDDGKERVRVATARLGRLDLQLVEPLTSRGEHRRFLDRHGGGVHHLNFAVDDANHLMDAKNLPRTSFGYLDAQPFLATRLQLIDRCADRNPAPWGSYSIDASPVVDLASREIVQLGIVVDDVSQTAAQYTRLLGVTDWRFLEFQAPDDWNGLFKNVPAPGARFHIKAAIAWHGAMQIELLQPVSGTSTHMDFLHAHGPGIHHLSFDVIDDHDNVRDSLAAAGIRTEMGGELGPGIWFTYLDTKETLGTIFEFVRRD